MMTLNTVRSTTLPISPATSAADTRPPRPASACVDPRLVESDLAAVERDGYVIWEKLLSDEESERIRESVTRCWITPAATHSRAAARNACTAS